MNATTLPPAQTNGASPVANRKVWLQSSVQEFFGAFNWEDHSPEVQVLRQSALQGSDAPLSLTLSVQQFFGAINWEGQAVAAAPAPAEVAPSSANASNDITLDDFSSLF